MPSTKNVRKLAVLTMLAVLPAAVSAAHMQSDGFAAGAQQLTQLFWLAETANVCQWASAADTAEFKARSVRFVSGQLSEGDQRALLSMIEDNGYEHKVRQAALERAAHYCNSNPLRLAWSTYQRVAQEHAFAFLTR
jgi:hypothetical protein